VNRTLNSTGPDPATGWFARWGGVLLVALTLLAHLPALDCGFIWDDDSYILNNATLRSPGGLAQIWFKPRATPQYYPMTFTTFWLEYRFWELQPKGFHVVNMVLHAAAALLLWRILLRLRAPGAWFAAALFALHPVMVESVAWVTERKNVLSTVFYLSSLLLYLRYRPPDGAQRGSFPRHYLPALGFFLLALLSKSVSCSLPAAILLILWWKNGRIERRDALALAPWFLIGLLYGLTTAWLEEHHVGASGAEWDLSFLARVLLAGRILWFYAGKLIWPHPLVFIYPRWTVDPGDLSQVLYPVAAAAVVLILWAGRVRWGRGPLAAVLFFAGTLFPALGFIDVYPFRFSYVADHFQYLASLGLFALAGAASAMLSHKVGRPAVAAATGGLILLALGLLTSRQIPVYRNLETLWSDTIRRNPAAWIAHNNLGIVREGEGRYAEALEGYRAAIRLKPDYDHALYNAGTTLSRLNRFSEAEPFLVEALRVNPGYPDVHNNLGNCLQQLGRYEEAIAKYRDSLRLKPTDAKAHFNLGVLYADTGRPAEAIAEFEAGLRLQPSDEKALYRLAQVLARAGRGAEAFRRFSEAFRLRPDPPQAHREAGLQCAMRGESAEALAHLIEALRAESDHLAALNALAWIRATDPEPGLRDGAAAVAAAERTVALTGKEPQPSVLDTLAAAYAEAGRFEEAARTAAEAERLLRERGQAAAAEEIAARRALYEQNQPYRTP
jgi:tetratricopeptide (TPR) repeat protein